MFWDESDGFWELGGGALNPPFSLYSGLFSTFSSLPSLFLETSHSRESDPSRSRFLLIFLLAEEKKKAIEFSLHSKRRLAVSEGDRWAWVQTSPPSRSTRRAKSSIIGIEDAATFLASILIRRAAMATLID